MTILSVILPVLNECPGLADTLTTLRDSAPAGALEIIVVDGGSRDGTVEMARPLADQVLSVVPPGRARQMHAGALAAQGQWLLFLHADTRLPDNWYDQITTAWTGAPRWTAFPLSFDRGERVYRFIERAARWRFRRTGVPQGDQAVAVRRDTYFSVGGYPDIPLMEEYALGQKLKSLGPVHLLPTPVVTSARRYEKNGPLRNALRNAFVVALYYLHIPPKMLAGLYR